jgi:hypothetical protein
MDTGSRCKWFVVRNFVCDDVQQYCSTRYKVLYWMELNVRRMNGSTVVSSEW